jgi:hypothetical protein
MKKILAVAALALSTLTAGSVPSKTYEINLSTPAKAGSVQLKAGRYRLRVEGTTATFTEVGKAKGVTTTVTVKEADKKFDDTRIVTRKDGEMERISEIDLGGSKVQLGF